VPTAASAEAGGAAALPQVTSGGFEVQENAMACPAGTEDFEDANAAGGRKDAGMFSRNLAEGDQASMEAKTRLLARCRCFERSLVLEFSPGGACRSAATVSEGYAMGQRGSRSAPTLHGMIKERAAVSIIDKAVYPTNKREGLW
jgi:hypothetical protein